MAERVEPIDLPGKVRGYQHPLTTRKARSVTSIITRSPSSDFDSAAMNLGRQLHANLEGFATAWPNIPNPEAYDVRLAHFFETYVTSVTASEQVLWGGTRPHEFAGTADLRIKVHNVDVVIDLKTGIKAPPAHSVLQVAAYARANQWLVDTETVQAIEPAEHAAILHLPNGENYWELIWVDVEAAYERFIQWHTDEFNRNRLEKGQFELDRERYVIPEPVMLRKEPFGDQRISPREPKSIWDQNSSLALVPGDWVHHQIFGVGLVLTVSGVNTRSQATVDFGSSGEKRLHLRYAPLQKL